MPKQNVFCCKCVFCEPDKKEKDMMFCVKLCIRMGVEHTIKTKCACSYFEPKG